MTAEGVIGSSCAVAGLSLEDVANTLLNCAILMKSLDLSNGRNYAIIYMWSLEVPRRCEVAFKWRVAGGE
jgi:hypothetical protein